MKISEKNIISIQEFMVNYVGIKYDGDCKLTHSEMAFYLETKQITKPIRLSFQNIKKEDYLRGDSLFVKDEAGKIIPYVRPKNNHNLLLELNSSKNKAELKNNRKKTLTELGYVEMYGEIVPIYQEMELEEQKFKNDYVEGQGHHLVLRVRNHRR